MPRLLQKVLHDANSRQSRNTDKYRFPPPSPARQLTSSLRKGVRALLEPVGVMNVGESQSKRHADQLADVVRQSSEFEGLYRQLEDEESRTLLIAVLAYRVLGDRHVKLPLNTPRYWDAIRMIQRDLLRSARVATAPGLGHLDDYDLSPLGIPVRLQAHLLNILNTFVLQQYRLNRSGRVVEVRPGDVVIDAGACWGDTALYFANAVGAAGTVVSYECEPGNLEILRRNLVQNQELGERIRVIPRALWSTAGDRLNFASSGPGSRLDATERTSGGSVITDTIDRRVQVDELARVNFIKMDIEGAELNALKGAEQTLKTWKPKLAISLYHALEHFWRIPDFIDSLNLGYRFYLDHFTIHAEETVLFASVSDV